MIYETSCRVQFIKWLFVTIMATKISKDTMKIFEISLRLSFFDKNAFSLKLSLLLNIDYSVLNQDE